MKTKVTFKLEEDWRWQPNLRFKRAWAVRVKGGDAFYLYKTVTDEWTTSLQEWQRYPNKEEALREGLRTYYFQRPNLRDYEKCRARAQTMMITDR